MCGLLRRWTLSGSSQPFVIAEGHKGSTVSGATGTSIYFPLARDVTVNYAKLDFVKSTRWGQLITAYGQ